MLRVLFDKTEKDFQKKLKINSKLLINFIRRKETVSSLLIKRKNPKKGLFYLFHQTLKLKMLKLELIGGAERSGTRNQQLYQITTSLWVALMASTKCYTAIWMNGEPSNIGKRLHSIFFQECS